MSLEWLRHDKWGPCQRPKLSLQLVKIDSHYIFSCYSLAKSPLHLQFFTRGWLPPLVWYLSKNNLSEVAAVLQSDTVIIGGVLGEESCGLELNIWEIHCELHLFWVSAQLNYLPLGGSSGSLVFYQVLCLTIFEFTSALCIFEIFILVMLHWSDKSIKLGKRYMCRKDVTRCFVAKLL